MNAKTPVSFDNLFAAIRDQSTRQNAAISKAIFSQIFFLVILFAAYNGLVFLPVLLSVAGPGQRRSSRGRSGDTTEKHKSASRDVAMVEVNKKLNGDSVQKEEHERETEVKERLLENGEAVA